MEKETVMADARFPFRPLRCSACDAIRAGIKAALLRHGCTPDEAASVTIEPGIRGIHPAAASVKAADGRQLIRLLDLADYDTLASSPVELALLAKAVSRAYEKKFS